MKRSITYLRKNVKYLKNVYSENKQYKQKSENRIKIQRRTKGPQVVSLLKLILKTCQDAARG